MRSPPTESTPCHPSASCGQLRPPANCNLRWWEFRVGIRTPAGGPVYHTLTSADLCRSPHHEGSSACVMTVDSLQLLIRIICDIAVRLCVIPKVLVSQKISISSYRFRVASESSGLSWFKFQVLTAAIMKTTVFCDVSWCNVILIDWNLITLMMDSVNTCEISFGSLQYTTKLPRRQPSLSYLSVTSPCDWNATLLLTGKCDEQSLVNL